MGALANAAVLAKDSVFRDRALAALIYQARRVMTEPESTPNHTFRLSFARSVVRSPEMYLPTAGWVMACDPTIATLAQVATVVNAATGVGTNAGAAVVEQVLLDSMLAAWDYLATMSGGAA